MPPRLNKRQLREQEELAALGVTTTTLDPHRPNNDGDDAHQHQHQVQEDEEEEQVASRKNKTSAFAALDLAQEDVESEDDAEPEQEQESFTSATTANKSKSKKKKKKKKPTTDDAVTATQDTQPTTETPSSSKTPKKSTATTSSKSKKTTTETPQKNRVDEMEEIDRVLAQLALERQSNSSTLNATGSGEGADDPHWKTIKECFSFDPKLLDADAELRRMFGSKVINSSPSTNTQRSPYHARFANNPHHSTSLRKTTSYLCTPEAGWPSPVGVLSLSPSSSPPDSTKGEWYTYVHSNEYKESQLAFLEVLQQADGNRLFNVLQSNPYNVDTLMQLSEMMVQQGDLGASSTWLSKALYALSSPLPPSFTSGTFRLSYSQIENRAFFLAIARKVAILTKRGTWRTAFEWCKIGLGVGGEEDPVGMLCFIDFLAPKAKQNEWFLSLLSSLSKTYPSLQTSLYPGLAYAKSLCLRSLELDSKAGSSGHGRETSTDALKSAILKFPMVANSICTVLGIHTPPKLVSHSRAQLDGAFTTDPSYMLSLLSEFYVTRSSPLWKEPPTLAWFSKTLASVVDSLDDTSIEDVRIGKELWEKGLWEKGFAPSGIIRAAYIAEIPSVRPYLPPSALNGTSYSYDPIPPDPRSNDVTSYDDQYFSSLYSSSRKYRSSRGNTRAGVGRGRGGGGIGGATNEAIAHVREQLANLLGLGGDGGPGVELNDELREELMAELHQLARAGGGVPGGFPGMHEEGAGEDQDEDNDDDEEGEEENPEMAAGFVNRLAALFRGGPAPAAGAGAPPG